MNPLPNTSNSGSASNASNRQIAFLLDLQRQHLAKARGHDPVTSHNSSTKLGRVTPAQQRILDAITARGPMTDSELESLATTQHWERAGRTYYRRRRSELSKLDLLHATGERRRNERGNTEMVWSISPPTDLTWALNVDPRQITKAQASHAISTILQSTKNSTAGNASNSGNAARRHP